MKIESTKNIGLIGFMGTGKTSIGQALAKKLGRQFFDTDTLVEIESGKTITELFEDDGESGFREMESKVVRQVCRNESAVISFGGGVVLSKSNVDTIRDSGIVVLLCASVESILKRTAVNNQRPLLNTHDDGIRNRIESLLESRQKLYDAAMDFVLDTDEISVDEAVGIIIRRLRT